MSIHITHLSSVLHAGVHRTVGAPRSAAHVSPVIGAIVLLLAAGTGAAVVDEIAIAVHAPAGPSSPVPSPQPAPPAVAPHTP